MSHLTYSLLSQRRRNIFKARYDVFRDKSKYDILVGHQRIGDGSRKIYIDGKRVVERSSSIGGDSGTGKSTFGVRVLKGLAEKDELKVDISIVDPEGDKCWDNFKRYDNVTYYNLSTCGEYEMFKTVNDLWLRGLNRSVGEKRRELIVVDESQTYAMERNEPMDFNDTETKEMYEEQVNNYKDHARRGRKRRSTSMNMIQDVFQWRKSVLRQTKTRFCFNMTDDKQILKFLGRPYRRIVNRIINAPQGVCYAIGYAIPTQWMQFKVAEVEGWSTSD